VGERFGGRVGSSVVESGPIHDASLRGDHVYKTDSIWCVFIVSMNLKVNAKFCFEKLIGNDNFRS